LALGGSLWADFITSKGILQVIKQAKLTTELFAGKTAPQFITDHNLFRTPHEVKKVFRSIGLPNFKDKANIEKCLVDLKKEGTYVHNLLVVMTQLLGGASALLQGQADKIQFLETKEARDAARPKLKEIYSYFDVVTALIGYIDPYKPENLTGTMQTSADGKIELRLMNDINDASGKLVFRKGVSLFSIFHKLKEKLASFNITFNSLDTQQAFKVFSLENIPNKEFSVVFSAEGADGAWDIATMSMRGIKSCQRWDGEYPRCLIGSILSKFVGLIYLTSGVQAETNAGYSNLGTKMMRRCVVRYAVDADEDRPCILIDKMYPELDKDVLSLFINAIRSKTTLPVYYTADLGNKTKHFYLPAEEMREKIIDREWSYQDTPLKSKHDLNISALNINKEEVEREIRGFNVNLTLFLARRMEEIGSGSISVDPEYKKIISNIKMNISYTPFCEKLSTFILTAYRPPVSSSFTDSKVYYRKYLMEILKTRKRIIAGSLPNLQKLFTDNMSRPVDAAKFAEYLFSIVIEFTKSEIKKTIS
jgi:hypothetical protein